MRLKVHHILGLDTRTHSVYIHASRLDDLYPILLKEQADATS